MNGRTAICVAGVVVALASEAKALTAQRAQPDRITLLPDHSALWLSGMGPVAARRAAEGLADAGAAALAVFGVAGALSPGMRSGSLFCPERILDENGHDYLTDPSWRARLLQRLSTANVTSHANGSLLSVQAPLLTAASKAAAHDRYNAMAVDMESAAVAGVAHQRGMPCLVLRAIIDEVGDTIPAALNDSVDAWGRPRPLGLMAALCRHPSLLTELPRLYSRMQRATHALSAAAAACGPALAWQP